MAQIPAKLLDLLQKPIICGLATVMPDGQPQVTPVWCDYDGECIRVNTARGRQKDRNMTNRAKVTVLLVDPANDHHWLEARGHIVESTEKGAVEHINSLSLKYTGKNYQNLLPGMIRVTYKIAVDKVNGE